jgi:hypothetical protein
MTAAAAGIAITCFFYHSAGISFRQLRQMLLEK